LPDSLKQLFRDELEQYEQERNMPYVTSIEQMTQRKIALKMLAANVPIEQIAQFTELSIEQIQQLEPQLRTQTDE
jgi:hypothetical protein